MKKFILTVMITVILLSSIPGLAASQRSDNGMVRVRPVRVNLFDDGATTDQPGQVVEGLKSAPPGYNPVGFWRQVLITETTQQDRQHYTSPGRQIVYAGYFNAGCDYVYIDYAWRDQIGATVLLFCKLAMFDWGGTHDWDFGIGTINAGPAGRALAPNVGATPDNASWVATYYSRDEALPWLSQTTYSGQSCPDDTWLNDTVPGPPNLETIVTGYCADENSINSPYVWPILDLDTTDDGRVITHIVCREWTGCPDVPTDDIDAASLVYSRKVAELEDEPWGGTWDGPHFIDSVYNSAFVVRADRSNDNHNVYLAYFKPLYYQTGDEHYCSGNGHYQLASDVVYRVSDDDGASWSNPIYVTDYRPGFEDGRTEPAVYELTGMVDPGGNLHIVWLSANRDPDDPCGVLYACRLWHWDSGNDCISLAFDASHPALIPATSNGTGAWNWLVAKPNVSWCDDKLYILFSRFGAHVNDTNPDLVSDIGASTFINSDIMIVGSDATGGMGQVWSDGLNLTDTETDGCEAPDCLSEHWPTMAMYSTDSLMIQYILDLEPGAKGGVNDENDHPLVWTDNPVIFMTWPCFAMADLDQNICVATSPTDPTYPEIPLAPFGNPAGCTTEGTYEADVTLSNCGNVNLSYTTSSSDAWLTVTGGNSGPISAGTGPRGSDDLIWNGKSGCASPATISWMANSASLAEGNYTGTITVDMDNPALDDFDIEVNLVVACQYYLPEFALISGGCWTIAAWNTPQTALQGDSTSNIGNMKFYACGDTINPLYHEGFVVGWKTGGTTHIYGDIITQDSDFLFMRALNSIAIDSVGVPSSGSGYTHTSGAWCTPDSLVYGITEYFVPGHQDTSVLIEKITLWNKSGTTLNDLILGEECDWDIDRDSSLDKGGIYFDRLLVYQMGATRDDSVVAGLSPYGGYDQHYGASAINGYTTAYSSLGHYPDSLYKLLTNLDGSLSVFTDSVNGTEMRTVHRFREGSMAPTDTFVICKVKAVSLDGVTGLLELIDKGYAFIENYDLCDIYEPPLCEGKCGDANQDTRVNVSDAVYVINYVFSGGTPPKPRLACGDANTDGRVNVSDAVYLINYVFSGGNPPGNCLPGAVTWNGEDCCEFTTVK